MSRYYHMAVEITDFKPEKADLIINALQCDWDYDYVSQRYDPNKLYLVGESNLVGGESEEEYAARVAVTVWRINGEYCEVEVVATYLEDLPYEIYTFDDTVFDTMKDEWLQDNPEAQWTLTT